MQETTITFRVRVSDNERHIVITTPTRTEPISSNVFIGIVRSLADFVNYWNRERLEQGT